jgi:hypothetical protein
MTLDLPDPPDPRLVRYVRWGLLAAAASHLCVGVAAAAWPPPHPFLGVFTGTALFWLSCAAAAALVIVAIAAPARFARWNLRRDRLRRELPADLRRARALRATLRRFAAGWLALAAGILAAAPPVQPWLALFWWSGLLAIATGVAALLVPRRLQSRRG